MENQDGQLFSTIHHKPSYEPYYLPFRSTHPLHMKKNIPFAMLLKANRYCSTFDTYLHERESLRMALLLNKYPNDFINDQFKRVLLKYNINEPFTASNYNKLRTEQIQMPAQDIIPVNHTTTMFVHFTYCTNMRSFPSKFHMIWDKYFKDSPIDEIMPILGTRNVDNLQKRLVHTRHSRST
jgi:hypothetical protein